MAAIAVFDGWRKGAAVTSFSGGRFQHCPWETEARIEGTRKTGLLPIIGTFVFQVKVEIIISFLDA
jgi:hypothetical protein